MRSSLPVLAAVPALVAAGLGTSCRPERAPTPEVVFFVDRAPRLPETLGRRELAALARPDAVAAPVRLGDTTMQALVPSLPSRIGYQVRLSSRPVLSFALAVATLSRPGRFSVEFRVTVDDGSGERVAFTERLERAERNRWLERRVDLTPWASSWVRLGLEARSKSATGDVYPLWGNPVLSDEERPPGRPDLVLISVDCLRPDHMGAYGYERDTSPHLDRLAEEGVTFENAVSTSAWTLPSHMSMLTGLTPSFHGVSRKEKLPPSLPYLPESLARSGYETIGVVSNAYLSPNFGFERGFHTYRVLHRSRARRTIDEALERLDAASGRSVFLFLHVVDPHWRYEPPAEFRSRFGPPPGDPEGLMEKILERRPPAGEEEVEDIIRLYDGEVAYTDRELGRLFAELRRRGRYDGALIVVTSDHGEAFWEHGYWQHSDTLYEEMIRIPLLVKWPGGSPRGRVEAPVSLIDLAPTLARAGGAGELPAQGRRLEDVVAGETRPSPFPRVSETLWDAEEPARMKVALSERGHKYVSTFVADPADPLGIGTVLQEELYDLRSDPEERVNLIQSSPSVAESFRQRLDGYLEAAREFRTGRRAGEEVAADELLEKRLRSLGYVH